MLYCVGDHAKHHQSPDDPMTASPTCSLHGPPARQLLYELTLDNEKLEVGNVMRPALSCWNYHRHLVLWVRLAWVLYRGTQRTNRAVNHNMS